MLSRRHDNPKKTNGTTHHADRSGQYQEVFTVQAGGYWNTNPLWPTLTSYGMNTSNVGTYSGIEILDVIGALG